MADLTRQSPVEFESIPTNTEVRHHWTVINAYADEGQGPWLVDLSHNPQWDLQDSRLDDRTPLGLSVPATPGHCRLKNHVLVSRLNRTQAVIWHLGRETVPVLPAEPGYTDISEASAFLALLGPNVLGIAEKLSSLDLKAPEHADPFMLQGPFSKVPCRIAVVERQNGGAATLLLTFARGYAGDMVRALLAAGGEYGLRPAGEDRFVNQLVSMNDPE